MKYMAVHVHKEDPIIRCGCEEFFNIFLEGVNYGGARVCLCRYLCSIAAEEPEPAAIRGTAFGSANDSRGHRPNWQGGGSGCACWASLRLAAPRPRYRWALWGAAKAEDHFYRHEPGGVGR